MWGYVYRVSNRDRENLRKREGGYEERKVTVYLRPPTLDDDPTWLTAFTFIATRECPDECGPPDGVLGSGHSRCRGARPTSGVPRGSSDGALHAEKDRMRRSIATGFTTTGVTAIEPQTELAETDRVGTNSRV